MIKNISLAMILLFGIHACTTKKPEAEVVISFKNHPLKWKELKISAIDMVSMQLIPLTSGEIDSTAQELRISLTKPTFATLQYGNKWSTIYFEPGFNLSIEENTAGSMRFSGKGSEPNTYLQKMTRIQNEMENSGGINLFELNQDRFLSRIDSMKTKQADFHKFYTDSLKLPKSIAEFLSKRNEVIILGKLYNYSWNYATAHNYALPSELSVTEKTPLDSTMLNYRVADYAMIMHMYMHFKYFFQYNEPNSDSKNTDKDAHGATDIMRAIDTDQYPALMKEFLSAKNIDYCMGKHGITDDLDSAYNQFKRLYPNSSWHKDMAIKYDRWSSISKGKPAPNFKGHSILGEEISLNSLKGKVVYVDVWATWCGPCLAEIPHSKALQSKFRKDENVVFLFVSIDENKADWEAKVKSEKEWNGTHIIEQRNEKGASGLLESYQIGGIPRHMLIDKKGLIANTNAPRPSSGSTIISEIIRLLKEK